MLNFIKRNILPIKAYLNARQINSNGVHVNDRLVIIESDDWGAIRTPSAAFLKAHHPIAHQLTTHNIYQNDALESNADVERLFEVLQGVHGADGQPAKLTANTIVANPDFESIKSSHFEQYFWEPVTATLARYPQHDRVYDLWRSGQQAGVYQPQFHGREHLQVNRWMRALQQADGMTRYFFDHGTTYSGQGDYSYMEAFDWDQPEDISSQKTILTEGLHLFEQIFGYRSLSFIAPCYNWDSALEPVLYEQGIRWIQTLRTQLAPTGHFNQYQALRHAFGEQSSSGIRYAVRNCFLEPSMLPQKDWVNSCMAQISSAFAHHKPAIICSHRINYIGYIQQANADRGLCDLQRLLKAIVKRWPEVQFISTDQLSTYISH